MKRRKGADTPLIPELEALTKEAHDRLAEAEFHYFKAIRALENAKRIKRYVEAGNSEQLAK